MAKQTRIFSIKIVSTLFISIILSACGGSSSSSGGAPAPVLPTFTLFTPGLYNGDLNLGLEGQNIVADDTPNPIVLEVIGSVAGRQQVGISFAQFSGTSSIGPDGEFSIPTGTFPLRITDRNNRVISTCRGELLFEGTFLGDNVSGDVTTLMSFACDRSEFGPLTANGTFEATQGGGGGSNSAGFGSDIVVKALNY